MKKSLLYVLSLSLFISCQKTNLDESIPTKSEDENPVSLDSRAEVTGKWHSLGFSYDVTGDHLGLAKNPVIDVAKLEADYTNRVIGNATTGSETIDYYGYNLHQYIRDIENKTNVNAAVSKIPVSKDSSGNGKPGSLFGGSISYNKNFKSHSSRSSEFAFASRDKIIQKRHIYINATVDLMKDYLVAEFLEDLDYYTPDQFIERYGTHVLTDVKIGGRLAMIFRSQISSNEDKTTKEKIVKSGLSFLAGKLGADGSSSTTITTEIINKNVNNVFHYKTYGGSKAIEANLALSATTPSVSTTNWENSIEPENAAIIEINWEKAIPIFEFIDDSVKKEAIRQACGKYIDSKALPLLMPLFRWYSSTYRDHYYTTYYYSKIDNYKSENIAGYVFSEQTSETTPLYESYKRPERDHFYTINELAGADNGYVEKKLVGYVYPSHRLDALPFYRYYSSWMVNHYYTTTWSPELLDNNNYKYEGIECYLPDPDKMQ